MNDDLITEAVFEYLENGSELPEEASKNPKMRFRFQTAIAKQTYNVAKNADSVSNTNRIRLDGLTAWFKWLTGGTAFGGMFLVVLAILDVI
jgi:hypothetical protein